MIGKFLLSPKSEDRRPKINFPAIRGFFIFYSFFNCFHYIYLIIQFDLWLLSFRFKLGRPKLWRRLGSRFHLSPSAFRLLPSSFCLSPINFCLPSSVFGLPAYKWAIFSSFFSENDFIYLFFNSLKKKCHVRQGTILKSNFIENYITPFNKPLFSGTLLMN